MTILFIMLALVFIFNRNGRNWFPASNGDFVLPAIVVLLLIFWLAS